MSDFLLIIIISKLVCSLSIGLRWTFCCCLLDFPLLSVGLSTAVCWTFHCCPLDFPLDSVGLSSGFPCWFGDIPAGLSARKVCQTNPSDKHALESHRKWLPLLLVWFPLGIFQLWAPLIITHFSSEETMTCGPVSCLGPWDSLCNVSMSTFLVFLKPADLTVTMKYPCPPLFFSAHQTHHHYHMPKWVFPNQVQVPHQGLCFGMWQGIPFSCGDFTSHGTPMVQMEHQETPLALLFKPNIISRFR